MMLVLAIFFTLVTIVIGFLILSANAMSDVRTQSFQGGSIVLFLLIATIILWVMVASGVHIHTGITITR